MFCIVLLNALSLCLISSQLHFIIFCAHPNFVPYDWWLSVFACSPKLSLRPSISQSIFLSFAHFFRLYRPAMITCSLWLSPSSSSTSGNSSLCTTIWWSSCETAGCRGAVWPLKRHHQKCLVKNSVGCGNDECVRPMLTVFLVNSSMALQCESVGECGGTDVTFEWLFARMYFRVVLEVCGLTECRTANLAFVWLFTGVNSSMIPKCCVPSESLVAHLAHVRFFAAVRALVIFQMGRLWELHAARRASEGRAGEKNWVKMKMRTRERCDSPILTCMVFHRCECVNDFLSRRPSRMPARRSSICSSFHRCVISCATTGSSSVKMSRHKCCNGTVCLAAQLLNFCVRRWRWRPSHCICGTLWRPPNCASSPGSSRPGSLPFSVVSYRATSVPTSPADSAQHSGLEWRPCPRCRRPFQIWRRRLAPRISASVADSS